MNLNWKPGARKKDFKNIFWNNVFPVMAASIYKHQFLTMLHTEDTLFCFSTKIENNI